MFFLFDFNSCYCWWKLFAFLYSYICPFVNFLATIISNVAWNKFFLFFFLFPIYFRSSKGHKTVFKLILTNASF